MSHVHDATGLGRRLALGALCRSHRGPRAHLRPQPVAPTPRPPRHRSFGAAGEALIAPTITRRLIGEFAARRDPRQPPAALAELTEREREILRLVARGITNAEIAGRLAISPLTVKTHVSNILRKLDCRDRAQLVNLAYETGLVTPGDTD